MRAFQFAHFSLKRLDALGFAGRRPGTLAGVDSGLLAPASQRVGNDSNTLPDPDHRLIERPLQILFPGLGSKPHRTLTKLRGYFLGAGIVIILPGNQTLYETRGDSHRMAVQIGEAIAAQGKTLDEYAAEHGLNRNRIGRLLRGNIIMRLEDVMNARRNLKLTAAAGVSHVSLLNILAGRTWADFARSLVSRLA